MISDKLYLEAEQSGITVLCGAELPLTKSVSLALPDGAMFIGIDDSVMQSRAEERVHLAHELGHCVTGAMYNIRCPIMPRQRYERIADAYAIKKLVDEDELRRVIDEREGDISVWELSEWFDVTEDFMRKAIGFYYKRK
nr:MAG TPA: IrrE protein [Caudoviricetes sp.]